MRQSTLCLNAIFRLHCFMVCRIVLRELSIHYITVRNKCADVYTYIYTHTHKLDLAYNHYWGSKIYGVLSITGCAKKRNIFTICDNKIQNGEIIIRVALFHN